MQFMGEHEVSTLIFPTVGGDLLVLVQALLGVSLDMAWHWCMFDKLSICLIFAYFSQLTIPVIGRPRSYYLNAFCLCIPIRYFLVKDMGCLDRRMCLVVSDLRSGNPIGLILAETLNGSNIVHKGEANFFAGSHLL